ncbi:ATP-binding protein [Candidatus Manganitrophus noduliformans]|uniref:histidine kinase n=1 Tax=Candidatus Manganitrophus noduliformans TaxID=2606439 RepID=A0A7X6DPV6_9BACT|nr:ATP-binding protein [Candidatus Manganitrophus noduliformans]NKE71161.1 response regulator [Candidatus Manganitrophus noduliformans]
MFLFHLTAGLALTAITVFLLGLFVLIRKGRERLGVLFFLWCLSISWWSFFEILLIQSSNEKSALFWGRIMQAGDMHLPTLFVHFILTLLGLQIARWKLIALYGVSTLLSVLCFTPLVISGVGPSNLFSFFIKPGPLYIYMIIFFISCVIYGQLKLYQAYSSASPSKKVQIGYFFWSSIGGWIGGCANFLLVYDIKIPLLNEYGTYAVPFFAVSTTYSIVRHQLMDIRTVIHMTIMWLTTFSLALIPILVVILPAKRWLADLTNLQISALISAYFVFLVLYIKTVQPRIDHFFQRRKYDMEKILHGMVKELALLKDLMELTEKIAATIREAMYVSHSSIILWEKKKQGYLNINGPNQNVDLSTHASFLNWMKVKDRVIEWNEIEAEPQYKEIRIPARNYFEALSAKIALPLVHEDQLIGVINLGEKDNLKPFTREDIEFLSTLRAQSTISLSNSLLYEDVHKMSEELRRWASELEEKVATRTHELSERTKELSESKTELERSYQKLQELDRIKSQFFANISHEFRTPLTLILAPLESFLNQPNLPEEQRKHFQIMYQNGLRLLKLINNLLDLAKIDTGKMPLSYSKTDLVAFIKGIISSLTPLTYKKQIHVSFLADRSVIEFYFDRDKIEKVLLNLLFNAIKFTERGGEIILSCAEKEGHVVVKVSDTGVGIGRENLHKLFSRFTQLDASATRQHEGTGIGLALSKELVELHQGKIWVESEVGRGTVISFTLPSLKEMPISSLFTPCQENSEENWFRSLHKTAEYAEGRILQESAALPPQFATEEKSRPKILIVEDNSDMLDFIGTLLQGDYNVALARNGAEGLERAKTDPPDLILADIMMPMKDGYQLCREIKEDLTTRHIPVVLVTAKADLSMKIEGLNQGADDYLTKPFSSEELKARVRSLLNLRTLEKEIQMRNQALEKTLAELRKTQTQLIHSAKMAALGTLVAGLSHEMNNPLTPVIGFAELLLGMPLPKEAHQCADTISREARRCAAVIRSLSDFARKSPPLWQGNDLNSLIHSVLELNASYLRTDNIVLELNLDPRLPKTLVDGNQIKQVLLNLINNAHQAVLINEEERRIQIVSEQTAGLLRITIGDNGPGIPKEVQSRLFEPFFTTKPEGEGTGLGLAISHGIIASHGGKLGFISEEGIGTRFWFELPIRTAASTAPTLPSETSVLHQDRRALVVDDEPMVLEVCKTALEQIGFVVDAVHSGEAALEQLTKTSYDLLVADIRMPGMGGIQFLEQVGRVYPEILDRTILITGDAVNSVTSAFLNRTRITVLEKPFDLAELQHRAKSILERNSTQRWRV